MSSLEHWIWRLKRARWRREMDRDDILAAVRLSALMAPGAVVSNSSLAPRTLLTITNFVQSRRALNVCEFGSGLSTLVLASLERERRLGIRLVSYEEDESFVGFLSEQTADLDGFEIRYAPLEPLANEESWGGRMPADNRWYSKVSIDDDYDIVIVDGPASRTSGQGLERWPALPISLPSLSENGLIVLDDVARVGEHRVMRGWASLLGSNFKCSSDGRAAFFVRNPNPSPFCGRIMN